MGSNAPKLADNGGVFIPLNMSQDVIVAHYLFCSIIIDGAMEVEMFRMVCQLILVVFNCLNNPCMELLPIHMGFKEESVANKINGAKNGHVVILGLPISIIMLQLDTAGGADWEEGSPPTRATCWLGSTRMQNEGWNGR